MLAPYADCVQVSASQSGALSAHGAGASAGRRAPRRRKEHDARPARHLGRCRAERGPDAGHLGRALRARREQRLLEGRPRAPQLGARRQQGQSGLALHCMERASPSPCPCLCSSNWTRKYTADALARLRLCRAAQFYSYSAISF